MFVVELTIFSPFISISGNPALRIRPYTLRVRYAERRLITANSVRDRMRSTDVELAYVTRCTHARTLSNIGDYSDSGMEINGEKILSFTTKIGELAEKPFIFLAKREYNRYIIAKRRAKCR
jgi:hypothetical protein